MKWDAAHAHDLARVQMPEGINRKKPAKNLITPSKKNEIKKVKCEENTKTNDTANAEPGHVVWWRTAGTHVAWSSSSHHGAGRGTGTGTCICYLRLLSSCRPRCCSVSRMHPSGTPPRRARGGEVEDVGMGFGGWRGSRSGGYICQSVVDERRELLAALCWCWAGLRTRGGAMVNDGAPDAHEGGQDDDDHSDAGRMGSSWAREGR